jgi:hypothetical protein
LEVEGVKAVATTTKIDVDPSVTQEHRVVQIVYHTRLRDKINGAIRIIDALLLALSLRVYITEESNMKIHKATIQVRFQDIQNNCGDLSEFRQHKEKLQAMYDQINEAKLHDVYDQEFERLISDVKSLLKDLDALSKELLNSIGVPT